MYARSLRISACIALAAGLLLAAASPALAKGKELSAAAKKQYDQAVKKAVDYLRTKGQADDGSFSAQAGPAITAVIATGLLENGRKPTEPIVAKALGYLEGFVQSDGGIYAPGSRIKNYETCVALLCFNAANAGHKYDKLIKNADKFVRGLQI